jgi:cytoskeletal protein CcmA (bactofilin family)
MIKMFSGGGSKATETTLIAEGALVEGAIRFSGVLEIEGRVNGDISTFANGQAVLRVMKNGQIFGNVEVPLVIINGSVTGNIRSTDHIELGANAVVSGDVYYNLIEMMRGAQVNGSLLFSESAAVGNGAPASKEIAREAPRIEPSVVSVRES